MQEFASKRSGLVELNSVVAVAAHRSFRKAAVELGMSPSALSHAVASLEQRMGVRLFHRTTRSVSLSQAGERFLARVQPALRDISEAMDLVNEFRDTPTGILRINTSEGAALQLFALFLAFSRRYPDVHLDLVTEGRLVDIVEGGFDAGIRLLETVPRDMIAVPCGPPQRFAVVGSPRYFEDRKKPVVPTDLLAHECIRSRLPSGTIFRWEFERHGEESTVDVRGSLTFDNHHLMLEAALEGAGLAYLTEWNASPHVAAGRLVRVLEEWTPPYPGLCLYYPGHRHVSAGLRAFIDVLRETPNTNTKKPTKVSPSATKKAKASRATNPR